MSEDTPSKAEGDRDTTDDEADAPPRTMPSQAEGDDDATADGPAADDTDG
ncbi:hypothetical protein [Streptomyces sp. NPDC003032]